MIAAPTGADERFRAAREAAARRRRSGRWRRLAVLAAALVIVLGAAGWAFVRFDLASQITFGPPERAEIAAPEVPELSLTAADPRPDPNGAAPADDADDDDLAAPAALIDLPGQPMRLQLGAAGERRNQMRVPRPELPEDTRGAGDLIRLQDTLIASGERVAVMLPSSGEDFAVFQAQRQRAGGSGGQATPAPLVSDASAGELAGDEVRLARPGTVAAAEAHRTWHAERARQTGRFLHGSSRAPTRATDRRHGLFEDTILRVTAPSPMADLLTLEGLESPQAEAVADAVRARFEVDTVTPGFVIALRTVPDRDAPERSLFSQLTLYDGERYIGSLARDTGTDRVPLSMMTSARPPPEDDDAEDDAQEAGTEGAVPEEASYTGDRDTGTAPPEAELRLVMASDPWVGRDFTVAGEAPQAAGPTEMRVLDALFSAAMRHGIESSLVGQIIMLLSEAHDLDGMVHPGDRFTLLMSEERHPDQDAALSQVLYLGIEGREVNATCYVFKPPGRDNYTCYGRSPGTGAGAAAQVETGDTETLTAGQEVETLVNRIIQIESAGRADARNPLSTATGLGQFIESTWIRMMNTYRPDLSATMSRAELLALRVEPDISREMVTHLAREGESYLRARGHQITAGRLYLCHFLGMEGAHLVLSSPLDADLQELLGAGVINANPFLRGNDVAWIINWAENHMQRASGRVAIIREPQELRDFRQAVDSALG